MVIFSPNKTNVLMFFQRKISNEPYLVFGGSVLKISKTHKYLGLTLSADAIWSSHIQNVCKVINGISTKKNLFKIKSLNVNITTF